MTKASINNGIRFEMKFFTKLESVDRLNLFIKIDTLLLWSFYLYLGFYAFDGLLRYIFSQFGVPFLLYVKDLIILLPIFLYLIKLSKDYLINRTLSIFILLSIISFFTSLLYVNDLPQTLFGARTFLPLVAGIIVAPVVIKEWKNVLLSIEIILVIFIAGIFVNYFWVFPWEGFLYEIGDVELVGSRDWTSFGVRRIAGFSRASFNAAILIMLLALFIAVYEKKKSLKYGVWFLSGIAIIITTTKTAVGAFFILSIILLVNSLTRKAYIRYFPLGAFVIMGILPFSTNFIISTSNILIQERLFASLLTRFIETWPLTINFIIEEGSVIFGRGFGGIGSAQTIFEAAHYTPADNLFLFVYGIFGIFGIGLLLWLSIILFKTKKLDKHTLFSVLVVSFTFLNGITVSSFENVAINLFFGISLYISLENRGMLKNLNRFVIYKKDSQLNDRVQYQE